MYAAVPTLQWSDLPDIFISTEYLAVIRYGMVGYDDLFAMNSIG